MATAGRGEAKQQEATHLVLVPSLSVWTEGLEEEEKEAPGRG